MLTPHPRFGEFYTALADPARFTVWAGDVVRQAQPRRMSLPYRAEGLVVPSARLPGGVNIVHYPTHRRDGSAINTLEETKIPFVHGL